MLVKMRRYPYLLPKPVAIVGALVDGKPNFLTIADISTTGYKIPRFVVSSGKAHYTNKGIIQNKAFSVNIPSENMVAVVDYCGMKSGNNEDKSTIFEVFYGKELESAPMIMEAPITHACRLVKTVDFGDTHYLFIGEILETFVNEEVLTEKIPDIKKVLPFSYHSDHNYWTVGSILAQSYNIGKKYKKI